MLTSDSSTVCGGERSDTFRQSTHTDTKMAGLLSIDLSEAWWITELMFKKIRCQSANELCPSYSLAYSKKLLQ